MKKGFFCIAWALCWIVVIYCQNVYATDNDCDKAQNYFWQGQMGGEREQALTYYLKAVELCPGFIRPYELIGNHYRNQDENNTAIVYFKYAAELGSSNYKLYYLLAALLYEENIIDESLFYLRKSIDLNGNYPKSIRLLKKIDASIDDKGPKIQLFEPAVDTTVRVGSSYDVFSVRGRVIDVSGVARLRINNIAVSIGEKGRFIHDIPVEPGQNPVFISATDDKGNTSIANATIIRAKGLADQRIYRKSFGIVIGINDYEKWPSLNSAVADALSIKDRFESAGFDDVVTVLDKDATRRRILTILYEELPKQVSRDDRVVFYFAGHGGTQALPGQREKGFIIPFESSQVDFPLTAISMEQIRGLTDRIAAKHIFFAMDCCYSGHILLLSNKDRGADNNAVKGGRSRRVIQILTAGAKDQMALEGKGHGLFTEHFLGSLDGKADLNTDNVVTGAEIGAYLPPVVSQLTQQFQTPLFNQIEGKGDIIFFLKK